MLWLVTLSGKVSVVATWMGTPTSLIARLGSGEMTVRPEKSTLLPDRFPLKRPCLPFSRCTNPLQQQNIGISATSGITDLSLGIHSGTGQHHSNSTNAFMGVVVIYCHFLAADHDAALYTAHM